ncbi:MAG: LytTR family DNA-binding domain-containing protein [Clostridiales bacterium]|jgi:DNA-binding LytR/AlgR family response regulator|nr:LytTR family DNA-binding domain-containing protein [Clostridiales bacterium]
MVRIAIVEDDDKSAETLKQYLDRYAAENRTVFTVMRFTDGMDIATDYKPVYDIILMDIQMKLLSGMDAAEYIRKFDRRVILIFITNTAQYAVKGYTVGALGFLLKPISYFAFSQQIRCSVVRLNEGRAGFLLLPAEGGMVNVDISQIVFIESSKHNMTAHTREGAYRFRGTIKELESKLGGKNFFRCNTCYLVNLAYVKAIKGCDVTVGKHRLVISQPRRKAFLAALADYVGRGHSML